MSCWASLFTGDRLIPLEGVQADVSITLNRSISAFVPNNGMPRYQRSLNAPREWSLSFSPHVSPDIVTLLRMYASGAIDGKPRLYMADAAKMNLISAQAADPGRPDWPGSGTISYQPMPTKFGTLRLGVRLSSDGSKTVLESVPVKAGEEYTISAAVGASASVGALYEIRHYGDDGFGNIALLSTTVFQNSSVPSVATVRSLGFLAHSSAQYFEIVQVNGTTGFVTGPRLVEGTPDDFYWRDGWGVPYVDIVDPAGVLNSTADNLIRSTYAVTIRECAA